MTHYHSVLHSDKHPPTVPLTMEREGELLFHIREPSSGESGLLDIPNQRLTSIHLSRTICALSCSILHTVHTVVAMVTSQDQKWGRPGNEAIEDYLRYTASRN